LSFTSDEIFAFLPGEKPGESIHTADWPVAQAGWKDAAAEERYALFMELRPHVLKALEDKRAAGLIGASLEAKVLIRTAKARDCQYLNSIATELPMLLIVSSVAVEEAKAIQTEVIIEKADGTKCPRCWNYKADIGSDKDHPEICSRCARAIKGLDLKDG
jgi:isoleucyl-tRNA synthetase